MGTWLDADQWCISRPASPGSRSGQVPAGTRSSPLIPGSWCHISFLEFKHNPRDTSRGGRGLNPWRSWGLRGIKLLLLDENRHQTEVKLKNRKIRFPSSQTWAWEIHSCYTWHGPSALLSSWILPTQVYEFSEFEIGRQWGWIYPLVDPENGMPVINLRVIPETTCKGAWKWNREGKVANKTKDVDHFYRGHLELNLLRASGRPQRRGCWGTPTNSQHLLFEGYSWRMDMNSSAFLACPKHGLRSSGVGKALRPRVPGVWGEEQTMVQKERVSRGCDGALASLAPVSLKHILWKISEHVEISPWIYQMSCHHIPSSDSMWQNEKNKISTRSANPTPLLTVLPSHLIPYFISDGRWHSEKRDLEGTWRGHCCISKDNDAGVTGC